MKLTKKQQKFIIEATTNSDVCSQWRTNIKETFPKLFKETEFVKGNWYKYRNGICCFQELYVKTSYGFFNGVWDTIKFLPEYIERPATDKEVETVLIKEYEKNNDSLDNYTYHFEGNLKGDLYGWNDGCFAGLLLRKGKWATIIETITKEEAEKQLGKTIKC